MTDKTVYCPKCCQITIQGYLDSLGMCPVCWDEKQLKRTKNKA